MLTKLWNQNGLKRILTPVLVSVFLMVTGSVLAQMGVPQTPSAINQSASPKKVPQQARAPLAPQQRDAEGKSGASYTQVYFSCTLTAIVDSEKAVHFDSTDPNHSSCAYLVDMRFARGIQATCPFYCDKYPWTPPIPEELKASHADAAVR